MQTTQNIQTMSKEAKRNLIEERLKVLFALNPQEMKTNAEKLFQHYDKLNAFPQSTSTLDVSIKALVGLWKK